VDRQVADLQETEPWLSETSSGRNGMERNPQKIAPIRP